jgi:hypothetical protein
VGKKHASCINGQSRCSAENAPAPARCSLLVTGLTLKKFAVVRMPFCAILYPRGGAFNKLRGEQSYLENLLKEHLSGYVQLKSGAAGKKNYVKEHIFDELEKTEHVFMIFYGVSPYNGKLIQPTESEAYKKIMQKLRSMKKDHKARTWRLCRDDKIQTTKTIKQEKECT